MTGAIRYAVGEITIQPQRVRIIEGGKLIIPAGMRRQLGISTGDTVLIDVADGELRVRSLSKAIERAQAILRRHVPEGVSLADELIADRRREADRE
jgi:AbrB family looped-hinge helix DNA binding protein